MPVVTVPDQSWIDAVGEVPGVDLRVWDMTAPLEDPTGVGVVVHPYFTDIARLRRVADLPDLRAISLLTAGYETAVPFVPPGVALLNAAGVHDASTAELAVTLVLASLRDIPDFVRAQDRGEWLPLRIWPALADKRVLVVGYGSIGRAIARRLAPFEVTITAVASTAREGDELVDVVHGIADLPDLLPHHDVVVLIVPLTPSTEGMVDAAFLAAMPDGALLVNMARGKVVDTDALVAATADGRLRVALDVTDPEPLPPGHPLWRCPTLLLSPHVGGASSAFAPRAAALLREQFRRYAAGEPLRNIVHVG